MKLIKLYQANLSMLYCRSRTYSNKNYINIEVTNDTITHSHDANVVKMIL